MTDHEKGQARSLSSEEVKTVPPVLEDKEVTRSKEQGSKDAGPTSTHPAKTTEASQDLAVKEAGAGRVSQGLVQEVVNEVDAGLHSEHHARLQVPSGAQVPQAGLVYPVHALGERTVRGMQEGAAPAQGHRIGGRKMETGERAGHLPCPCRRPHVGPGSGPMGPPGAARGSVTMGVSSPDSALLCCPRHSR